MKKILSVLLAVVLCFSLSVMAFAEDTTVEETTTVVDETTTQAPEEIVEDVLGEAKEIADKLVEEINKVLDDAGAQPLKTYLDEILAKIKDETGYDLAEYVYKTLEDAGIDIESAKVVAAEDMDALVDAIFDAVEANGGDVNAFYEWLVNSKIVNWFASIYVPTPEETTAPVEETTVAPTEAPETGDAPVFAGVAVLAVAAAAAVICTKKAKKDEE